MTDGGGGPVACSAGKFLNYGSLKRHFLHFEGTLEQNIRLHDLISDSLTVIIFNKSIEIGMFPDEWKNARVTPLYRNTGKRTDMTNYRPI